MEKKRKGKKRMRFSAIFAAAFLTALMLSGCGRGDDAAKEQTAETQMAGQEEGMDANGGIETQEGAAEETEEEIPEVLEAVVSETSVEDIATTGGVVLISSSVQDIHVTIPGNAAAADQINQFFADRKASFADTVEAYREIAQEDLEYRAAQSGKEDLAPTADAAKEGQETEGDADKEGSDPDDWHAYELGISYSVKRVDEQMISIVEDSYEYTGGAHPNSVRVAYNFDTQTGERLKLEDVASDLDEIRTESIRYLGELLQDEEWQEVLFSDYQNHLEDILTDSTWYTDQDGFYMICNEYIITPHSEGILEFLLPYDEVDVVDKAYKPMADGDESDTGSETMDDQSESPQNSGD